jgi:hypothetical protein
MVAHELLTLFNAKVDRVVQPNAPNDGDVNNLGPVLDARMEQIVGNKIAPLGAQDEELEGSGGMFEVLGPVIERLIVAVWA